MTMREFVRENRDELDRCIRRACDNCRLNDDERENWVLNDEGLYQWARMAGVQI